jgi:Nitroreductase
MTSHRIVLILGQIVVSILPSYSALFVPIRNYAMHRYRLSSPLVLGNSLASSDVSVSEIFDGVVNSRYACTRFQRNDGTISDTHNATASVSDSKVVETAVECLDVARRSPSGFNAQPYKFIVVHSKSKKEAVAKYCLGRNADRVRDSDCTVIFLSDKESLRGYKRFKNFLNKGVTRTSNNSPGPWAKRKIQLLILLFSSGWPLPRILGNPISFVVRTAVSCVSVITRRRILVPSLASADTWSTKNTMLVAMTYMLACTSRGLATCPMEGYNIGGLRKVLKVPKRYGIPLIVSTGQPFLRKQDECQDDVGMEHGTVSGKGMTRRFPKEEMIIYNIFTS